MRKKTRFYELDRYDGEGMLKACLYSGGEDDSKTRLVLSAFGWYLAIFLPSWVLRPYKFWVDTTKYNWSNNPEGGYWNTEERAYGFYLFENHFNVLYGRQSNEGNLTKQWGFFLPWKEWRHVRFSLYDLEGNHFWSQDGTMRGMKGYDDQREATEECPKCSFLFKDYDGEEIEVVTHIEEREWHRGIKWCKWLSFFYAPMIRRSLDLNFKKETGPRKGSWKGGTLGHSIEMEKGELHEAAFRRYCEKNRMTFIGAI